MASISCQSGAVAETELLAYMHACRVCLLASNPPTCSCSVFFVGYTLTNICGGYLATRFTAKLVLGLGVVVWSAFTILTPVAASTESVYVILACRCVMGAGEGVTFPSIQHLQGKWCPANRRTFANTLIFAGGHSHLSRNSSNPQLISSSASVVFPKRPASSVSSGSLLLLPDALWICVLVMEALADTA